MAAGGETGLVSHEERGALLAEAHARPFHPAATPQRFIHFAFTTDAGQADADRAALVALCRNLGLSEPAAASKHHWVAWRDLTLLWEQHTEFTTYTWAFPGKGPDMTPGARSAWMRRVPQPGPLMVAVDLELIKAEEIDPALFDPSSLTMAWLDGRAALAATDFRPDLEGFVRFLVADIGLTPVRAGALVQRLLELETYRMFALLGLPEARRLGPEVSAIERELVALTVASTAENPDLNANHDLLQALTTLAARLEAGAAGSIYRFGASRAYAEIVRGRLEAIAEQPRSGYLSFSGFLARRLGPAMLTCTTMEDRQAMLSRKLARAAQLLRTRVDIELEHQNRDLLLALNTRTRLQLRLQQTVEALSIAAASYYVVGLIGHAMDALPRVGIRIDPTLATALSVPIVVLGIGALFIVRLRAVDEEAVQEAEAHARPPARPAVSGPG